MIGTVRVLRSEAYRLARSRGAWVATGLLALVPALRVYGAHLSAAATRAERAFAGRGAPAELEQGAAWAPFVDGWRAGLVLGAFVLLAHAARSLAADRESGVLRLATTRSATRSSLVVARALLAPFLVVGTILVSGLGSWLVARQLFEFGPLVEDGYEIMSAGELTRELALATSAAAPAMLALYCFGLLVSAAGRSAVGAVSVALALFLGFDLFKEVLGDDQYWVFAAYVPSLVDTSAMGEMTGLARGFSDAGFPAALQRMNFLTALPETLLLVAAGCWVSERRSL